jgi:alkylated DNA repair dioxygenase AlkB
MTPTLDLFATDADPARNLLPADGEVYDHGRLYGDDEALALFSALLDEVAWQHDELVIAGKRLVTARQVAWYGDREEAYRYSGSTKVARPWTPLLLAVKAARRGRGGEHVQRVLAQPLPQRRRGHELAQRRRRRARAHPDHRVAEPRGPAPLRPSAQADRRKVSLVLDSGQLVVMAGVTQRHWEHALPKTKQGAHAAHQPDFPHDYRPALMRAPTVDHGTGSCVSSSSVSSMYAKDSSPGVAQRASPRLWMRSPP